MIDYTGLDHRLRERGLTRSRLTALLGISSRTIAKIGRGEKLSRRVTDKLCLFFACAPEELCRSISDNPILQTLRDEKEAKISGGLYHELQVRLTYNSNHIEGSRLTEQQTRMIFETRTVDGTGISVGDIADTSNHFRAVDRVIDRAEDTLSEELIKELHFILKNGAPGSDRFPPGEYKALPNLVGGRKTAGPAEVPGRMAALLEAYNHRDTVTIEDVIAFHADLECIHPFQDGNGRVGRLIALKECLRWGIVPFIIEDAKKSYYYRGLAKWPDEKGWLLDTCLDGQDTFKRLLALFEN
ncbi:MAG: Fic family protein [Abditibacteriota bacterium]|nr:Fic family protein [Abditibacteriota bacterium]